MASQQIPYTYDPVVQLLEDAADGAGAHGVAVGLKQNTEAAIRADLEALAGKPAGPGGVPAAVPGLKGLWNAKKAAKTEKGGLFVSAKSNGRTLLAACVNVLKPRLGNSWSNVWQNAGFTNGSLAIPANPLTMLQQMRAYFEANPTHEKEEVAVGIDATAEACEAAAQAISTASTNSNQSNVDAGNAKKALDQGIKAARRRLTGLREELSQLMGGDDERWYAFGFEKPDDPVTPEVPETLVLTDLGAGGLAADWDDARRAESYRAKVENAGTNAVLATKIVADSDADFAGLPTGVLLRVRITALNDAGESQPGEAVTITLSGAVTPPPPAAPTGVTFAQGPNPGDAVEANANPVADASLWEALVRPLGSSDEPTLVASSATLPTSFTSLSPGDYEGMVRVTTPAGVSELSAPVSFTVT